MQHSNTADAGLQDAAVRLRALVDALPQAYCEIEVLFEGARPVDYRFLTTNCHFERQTGMVDAIGRTVRRAVADHAATAP